MGAHGVDVAPEPHCPAAGGFYGLGFSGVGPYCPAVPQAPAQADLSAAWQTTRLLSP